MYFMFDFIFDFYHLIFNLIFTEPPPTPLPPRRCTLTHRSIVSPQSLSVVSMLPRGSLNL